MLYNAFFNSISVISRRSDLLEEKNELTTLVMIGSDNIGSYKSNYDTMTTMACPTYTQ